MDAAAGHAIKALNHAWFCRSTLRTCDNAVEAFLGTLPGHGYLNVRRPLLHSLNLADLAAHEHLARAFRTSLSVVRPKRKVRRSKPRLQRRAQRPFA